jgi:hypothetical protein
MNGALAAAEQAGAAERAFVADLAGGEYLAGEDRARWRLLTLRWPIAEFAVSAAPREGAPAEYVLHFELEEYLGAGVTAQVWDPGRDAPVEPGRLPDGGPATVAFNPGWPVPAIYIATDRRALEGHDNWRGEHPGYVWDRERGIAQYLQTIHEILNDEEYTGVREAA